MSKLRVTVNDGRRVTVQEMFLPGANAHPPWVRKHNEAPIARVGRDPSPEGTRSRMFQGGVDEHDVLPDSNNSLLGREPDGECNCNKTSDDAGEAAAKSLAKLADIEELRFFRHCTEDEASADVLQLTVPLLIKLLEWSGEEAKTDEKRHEMVEMLIEESNNGQRVLDMQDYEKP